MISMEFTTYRLQDICDVKSGKRLPAGSDFSECATEYPYIRARDIKKGKINKNSLAYISEEIQSKIKKYIINDGDIALTIVANIGDIGYCETSLDGVNLTENAVRLTNFKKSINTRYLTYYLSQPFAKLYMEGLAAGVAQSKLGIYKVNKIKVTLPDLNSQMKIVSIVRNYDQLIENNNKRIKLLEDMAESLFKEWFVRFRIPGYEKIGMKVSELGKIPTTFDVLKINKVFDYYVGGGWGNEDYSDDYPIDAYVIRGADFPGVLRSDISTCPYRYHKRSNYEPRQLKENDIVFEISGGTAEQPVGRAILVTKGILNQLDDKVICASFCKLIRPKYDIVKPHYFYQWLKFFYETRMIERFQLQSTGIINFKFEYFLRKGPVLVPPTELVFKYDELVAPMREEIDKLAIENSYLTKQRDSLLPRLMSGKLSMEGKEVI